MTNFMSQQPESSPFLKLAMSRHDGDLNKKTGIWEPTGRPMVRRFLWHLLVQIPVMSRHCQIPTTLIPSTCGSNKFQLDDLGDHVKTCTVHSGTNFGRTMTGQFDSVGNSLFGGCSTQPTKKRHNRWPGSGVNDVETLRSPHTWWIRQGTVSLVLDLYIIHERYLPTPLWGCAHFIFRLIGDRFFPVSGVQLV